MHGAIARAQFGNLQGQAVGAGVPGAFAVTVVAVDALWALLVVAGAAACLNVEFHEALGRELHHLAQHVNVGSLLGEQS